MSSGTSAANPTNGDLRSVAAPPISASRLVLAPADTVFRYLADLANHERLAPRTADLTKLYRRPGQLDRATVRLRGPLGLRRTASTELVRTEPPRLIVGRAMLGSRTSVSVSWTIATAPTGSVVSLSATIEAAGPLDSLVLHLGGRSWIARRFALALDALAAQLEMTTRRAEYERGLSPSPGADQRLAPWPTTAATANTTLLSPNNLSKEPT
jgi:uncharacterized protein YndB with AHSA1/START domain